MGCAKVSAGCKNCYMFREQKRFGHDPTVLRRSKTTFEDPLKWKEPRRIFVCSWSDFFLDKVPVGWRTDALGIMYDTPQHTYMLLTKRPENILRLMTKDMFEFFLPNVWLGVSVESQDHINRIGELYDIPASIKFLSAEPLLGPLDLSEHMGFLDWVITGGESDLSDPRPCDLDWVRSIRDQCAEHGVAFFHKQGGGSEKCKCHDAWGCRLLDGRTWDEYPEDDK
jgi:protein gp37